MRKLIWYLQDWNDWRKHNLNGRLHHFLVLIGFIKSPTFGCYRLYEGKAKTVDVSKMYSSITDPHNQ